VSTQIFPSTSQCPGIDISISRTVEWDTIVQEAVSGKEVRIARRQYPRREFQLKFNFLRSSTLAGFNPTVNELATFEGFFNSRQGMFDSFLWKDPDDNSVTNQFIGTGDGVTASFITFRTYGGFAEPVYAPTAFSNVTVGSTSLTSTQYSVASWGSTSPGLFTFSTAPPAGQNVTASFTYNWPVHFLDDKMTFDRFVNLIYEGKKVSFKTII
jgi:uncharacterized protein (TIGR02217 family)